MKDFTSGNESRLILNFALPMLLGNVFMQTYQLVDSIIVGQYLGKEALAAVGASTPIIFMIVSLIMGVGIGASVVVSQYFGAKEYDRVRATCDTLFLFLLVAGGVVSILGVLFSRHILHLMGLPDDVLPHATEFLQIYFVGAILLFGYNAVSAVLRGVGDSKTPLYFLILSSALNVGLDFLFILGFGWGIAGAAWATTLSQGVAFILCVIYVNRRGDVVRVRLRHSGFDWKIFRQCLRLGLPTGLQQMFVGAGNTAVMSIVSGFGTNVIAAYSAAMRIDMFASLPIMNFSAALTSFVGQNIAVGRFDRIHRGLRSTLAMSIASCILINLSIILFSGPLIGIFTDDPAVIASGRQCLIIMNSFYCVFGIMFTFNGILRGAGAAIVPMLTTMLSLWLVRVPAAAFFSARIGEEGIWWAVPIGWALGAIGSIAYYFSGKWKTKAVVFKGD